MSDGLRNSYKNAQRSYRGIDPNKHFCVIVTTKGRVLACGDNYIPAKGFLPSIHAEVKALSNAAAKVQTERGAGYRHRLKVDVVVARTSGGNSRPCSECASQIFNTPHFNVRRVIYSDPNSSDSGSGYTSIKPGSLYETRYQHISKGNLRRFGFVGPDGLLHNPYNPNSTTAIGGDKQDGNNAIPSPYDPIGQPAANNNCTDCGNNHEHNHGCDVCDDEDDGDDDGEKPRLLNC